LINRFAVLSVLLAVLATPVARAADASFQEITVESLRDQAKFPGKLYLPEGRAQSPVVVMIPGTDGPDGRQPFHREPLLAAGIGTFEIDTKTGNYTSAKDRPEADTFVPLAYAALRSLKSVPEVDMNRVAIFGWSLGATVSVKAAYESNRQRWTKDGDARFIAHVAFYGGCWQTRELANVPILMLVGDNDAFPANKSCPTFARNHPNVKLTVYPGVRHGFDIPGVNKGRGDNVMLWNEPAALDARKKTVEFLSGVLK
jgi:dienelactone hydrolase